MKITVQNLSGAALDYAVAICEQDFRHSDNFSQSENISRWLEHYAEKHKYSTDWAYGGPVIERNEIGTRRNAPCSQGREWEASPSITARGAGGRYGYGPTPLIAAMRCYVASKLGEEVDVPEELL